MRLILSLAAFFLTIHSEAQVSSVSQSTVVSAPLEIAEFIPSNKFSGDFRYRQQETRDASKECLLAWI